MSFYQLLPSFHEAFARLAQTRERGCLLVFNAREAIHLFVQDGMVIGAKTGDFPPLAALEQAFQLKNSSYGWIPGAEPEAKTLEIDMQDYLQKKGIVQEARAGKTIRIPQPIDRREKKLELNYYFIPEASPTVKLKVRKITNVVGRESACDICLDSNQVSRKHCLIQVTERGLLVKDLESTNGIFVNGMPMADGYLNDGDKLSLGTYVLTLYRDKS